MPRHNCWCYILGDNILRYSDDGGAPGHGGPAHAQCVPARGRGQCVLRGHPVFRWYTAGSRRADPGLWKGCPGRPLCRRRLPPWACGSRCSWSATMACWSASKLEIAAVDGILDDVVYAAQVTVTASLPGDGPPAAAAAAHRAFRRLRHLAVPGPGPSPGSERRNIGAVSTRPGLR